jgi:hypothetical protein
MKFLKQFIIMIVASCVLAVGAMAVEPQKDGQNPPPPKPKQEVPKQEKPPPPRNDNNSNRGGNDNRRGKP